MLVQNNNLETTIFYRNLHIITNIGLFLSFMAFLLVGFSESNIESPWALVVMNSFILGAWCYVPSFCLKSTIKNEMELKKFLIQASSRLAYGGFCIGVFYFLFMTALGSSFVYFSSASIFLYIGYLFIVFKIFPTHSTDFKDCY